MGCVQLSEEDLKPYLDKVGDRALKHALEYGVAFLHETQLPAEQEVVNLLFNTGAIQVCLLLPWSFLCSRIFPWAQITIS